MWMCVHLCEVYMHVGAIPMEARSGQQIPLELELQAVVSCHVGAENGAWVLAKSSQHA